jgi:two-component system chemotaxis response regulator CheB
VLTLDVEMPHMDGITFLRNLMRLRPMPVVMISTLTDHGAEVTLDALALGAVDFVTKPKINAENTLADYSDDIIGKVRAAAKTNVSKFVPRETPNVVKAVPYNTFYEIDCIRRINRRYRSN